MAVKRFGPFTVGDEMRLSAAFRNLAGELANPSSVTLTVADPAAVETVFEYAGAPLTDTLVHPSKGAFYADVLLDSAGTWSVRWQAGGAVVAAEEAQVTVAASVMP